ncbi:hypothetical protein [Azospirillum aestuarii]|uniref:hypothetical protein n=1 Tax=Azospirillum aestuarii TaxID=2802052 RepID=UPI0040550AF3
MSTTDLDQRLAAAQVRATNQSGAMIISARPSSRKERENPAIASVVAFTGWASIAAGVFLGLLAVEPRGYSSGYLLSFEALAVLLAGAFWGVMLLGFAKVITLLNVIANNTRPMGKASEG